MCICFVFCLNCALAQYMGNKNKFIMFISAKHTPKCIVGTCKTDVWERGMCLRWQHMVIHGSCEPYFPGKKNLVLISNYTPRMWGLTFTKRDLDRLHVITKGKKKYWELQKSKKKEGALWFTCENINKKEVHLRWGGI